ncbi:MAG: EFR1 family ferrodoxin [Candidatus Nanoarchaeia archaeon]|nr:EFR1 family ferrodoxin [Candidatus Nanoarchaeia archaeon]MDD5357903.1 EFR1 family ferrodoxin [Candidatus Nanoarchaeia archaeon]MDD5588822.1 EFR1 family ferrodoxin [Candidatus Nanoarchaeia archaeon]
MTIGLFYYSETGNTKIACEYIKKQISGVELIDISEEKKINWNKYDLVGFATSTYYLNIPPKVYEFLNSINKQNSKPVFLLATFGVMPGRVLKNLEKVVKNKGFEVIAYHKLHMPESYPPFIAKNLANLSAPNNEELKNFREFISEIKEKYNQIKKKEKLSRVKVKMNFWDIIIPPTSNKKIMKQFGILHVDKNKCNSCKICYNSCPYQAIKFNKTPSFLMDKCKGCFVCYNKCPQKAIYTDKISGGFYNRLNTKLKEKFK